MDVGVNEYLAEALKALGEAQVEKRFLVAELANARAALEQVTVELDGLRAGSEEGSAHQSGE